MPAEQNAAETMRQPWLAVILSSFLPGAGQFYAGRTTRAVVLLALTAASWCIGLRCLVLANGDVRVAYTALLIAMVLSLISWVDAHGCVRKTNDPAFEQARRQSKHPWLAAFLSILLPGLGHCYARRWLRGLLVFVSLFILDSLLSAGLCVVLEPQTVELLIAIPTSILTLAAAWWAYVDAGAPGTSSQKPMLGPFVFAFLMSVVLLSALRLVRQNVVEPFAIVSHSMAPTIEAGDRILVWTSSAPLCRGDLVAFYMPEKDAVWLHRLVAFAGETVEIREADGKVYINGERLDTPPFNRLTYTQAGEYGTRTGPHRVKPDCFFQLGDNSERSSDSRMCGDIPLSDVRGVAYKIWYPLSRAGPIPVGTGGR